MPIEVPASLQPAALMRHMEALCRGIGPRPPCSSQEQQAAEYVKKTLAAAGVTDVTEQPFKSYSTFGWVTIPLIPASLLAVALAWSGWNWGKWLGGVILLICAYVMHDFLSAQRPFFHRLIARGNSRNVIARLLPPSGKSLRTIFLIGHLDTQKQRFMAPPPNPAHMRPAMTLMILTLALGGLTFLADIWVTTRGIGWGVWLAGALVLVEGAIVLYCLVYDERQPHIEGANDNASAVSILLGVAEAWQTKPLANSEVVLLFTGCEEVMCVGMEAYLRRFKPPQANTYWIDLEMVGTGNLCYVTRHGVSVLTDYTPHPQMVELAAQTAQQNPELGVSGKPMLIIEELANLRLRDYKAVCLAGYDAHGWLPNWHRLSDNLANIEPETLGRAAHFTWALMQTIDELAPETEAAAEGESRPGADEVQRQ